MIKHRLNRLFLNIPKLLLFLIEIMIFLKSIKYYFQKAFRLLISHPKRQSVVWEDLKKTYINLEWTHDVYEDEKAIQAYFDINNEQSAAFIYQFEDNQILYRSLFFFDYSEELTTDLFVLATHINNVLKFGMIMINLNNRCVEYIYKEDIAKSFLYPEDVKSNIVQHLQILNDTVFPTFHRLIYEKEIPAIIFADLMRTLKVAEKYDL